MLMLSLTHIIHEGNSIPGLCIVGRTYDEAIAVADMALAYYETRGPKEPIVVSFSTDCDKNVTFQFDFSAEIGAVHISGIKREVHEKIVEGVKTFGAFFIILGFGEQDVEVISPRTFHMVKRDIFSDDEYIMGPKRNDINWVEIFRDG